MHSGLGTKQKSCFRAVKIMRGKKYKMKLLRFVKKIEGI